MRRTPFQILAIIVTHLSCTNSATENLPEAGVATDVGKRDAGFAPDANAAGDANLADSGVPALDEALSALASAHCKNLEKCRPYSFGWIYHNDFHECLAQYSAFVDLNPAWILPSSALGLTSLSESGYVRCIESLADCSYDHITGFQCNTIFVGAASENGPCYVDFECAPTLYCELSSFDSCGVCRPTAATNEECGDRRCHSSAVCLPVAAGTACKEGAALLGEHCGVERGCISSLFCVDGECAARETMEGAECDESFNGQCDPYHFLECVDGRCSRTGSIQSIGQPCDAKAQCSIDQVCDGVCRMPPSVGMPCERGLCSDGYCNREYVCAPFTERGGSCSEDRESCSPGLFCSEESSSAKCQPFEWSECR
jgi:hypothetical protein